MIYSITWTKWKSSLLLKSYALHFSKFADLKCACEILIWNIQFCFRLFSRKNVKWQAPGVPLNRPFTDTAISNYTWQTAKPWTGPTCLYVGSYERSHQSKQHRRTVDKTNTKSTPQTVAEHLRSHNHRYTDMQQIPLELIHSPRDPIRKAKESFGSWRAIGMVGWSGCQA